jgi:hypothetical protein
MLHDYGPGSYPGTEAEFREMLAATPMLQPPHMDLGKVRTYAPLEFFALTNQPREDLDGLGADFGLFEEPCETVDKRGVRIFNMWFTGPGIAEYVTGKKKAPKRNLRLRYDRALAARRVLESVQLLELAPTGECVRRLELRREDRPHPQWSRDLLLRERNAHLSAMLKIRDGLQTEYREFVAGEELTQRLTDEALDRQRRQRQKSGPPRPATPIYADEADGADDNALAAALGKAAVSAAAGEATKVSQEPEAPAENGKRKQGETVATAPAKRLKRPAKTPKLSTLANALGGAIGFQSRTNRDTPAKR